MTFYQELQLSSAGSKQLIKNTTDKKEKWRHILIYNFKVYLVMAFCVAAVSYTHLFCVIFKSGQNSSEALPSLYVSFYMSVSCFCMTPFLGCQISAVLCHISVIIQSLLCLLYKSRCV